MKTHPAATHRKFTAGRRSLFRGLSRSVDAKKITIFGAGYVGVVSAACLARDGYRVTAVEPVASKVEDLNDGNSPIQEPEVSRLLGEAHRQRRLTATDDPQLGVTGAEMVWVCVGTPSLPCGGVNLENVEAAIRQIGHVLQRCSDRPLIVIRSTCLPGVTADRLAPALEAASGLKVGQDIDLVFHPEFLREGSSVADFDQPPKIVIGEDHPGAGDRLLDVYRRFDAPLFRVRTAEAELLKYCDNLFHAVKVTFANEIGILAKALNIDARRVADVFLADTKLNISPKYLRPGFAFGGSCLPKDARAILRQANQLSLRLSLLEGAMASNAHQVDLLVRRVMTTQPSRVGMVGLAFKPNTDDMRESPYLAVAKRLIGEGVSLRIFDPGVNPHRLIGGNQQAVKTALRHFEPLLVDSVEELDCRQTILINHPTIDAQTVHRWTATGIRVIDLADIPGVQSDSLYEGIAW